jgi:hypothetical protein
MKSAKFPTPEKAKLEILGPRPEANFQKTPHRCKIGNQYLLPKLVLEALYLRVLMVISKDSMNIGGFQKLSRGKSDSESDSAFVGDHFDELFRLDCYLK